MTTLGFAVAEASFTVRFENTDRKVLNRLKKRYQDFIARKTNHEFDLYITATKIKQKHDRTPSSITVVSQKKTILIRQPSVFSIRYNSTSRKSIARVDDSPYAINKVIRIYFSLLLLQRGGFVLHGSAFLHKKKAYVFLGKTGSGKSTVTRLVKKPILGDDWVAIVPCRDRYRVFATPFDPKLTHPSNLQAYLDKLMLTKRSTARQSLTQQKSKDLLPLLIESVIPNFTLLRSSPELGNRLFESIIVFANKIRKHYILEFRFNSPILKMIV